MVLKIGEKLAGAIAVITAISSTLFIAIGAYYEVKDFTRIVEDVTQVVNENSKVIKSLEKSIQEVPVKVLVEHDAGVLFATLNYPHVTDRDSVHDVIESWFSRSSGIQIQSLVNLCKHDRHTLEQIIYSENIRIYCPRFGSWADNYSYTRDHMRDIVKND